jgi:hypothetical protein
MPRVKMPSVSEAAAQILREVEAEQRIKTAEVQLLHGVKNTQLTSEEARDLIKLANECRKINIEDPEVTYDDLHNFMTTINARRTA